ncbi:GTP binding protein EngB [Mycoplasma haemofelis str. Langford 1]|uniref:GTP binding protein EngB n=2 Tax=Mycoplasma haemofelis TaxID=29501 RepID=F6FFX0_MYCHI|nr:ribosome biogenesis GTP-binding protein YihA/YsxC [Mycoplasma haemofelis]AEG72436.1 GTP binding protein EngB [Mycoplasma haemofelis Ohio2]CBY92123.1 GTP binding protein EngB [Mycoplasma haemofelis str. Langford 1]
MARFMAASRDAKDYPMHSMPEFFLIGPSNAGKSTLINSLAKAKIAKTSKSPGKTRTINFYDFDKFCLVDMPGYGFDRKGREGDLLKVINEYLTERPNLIGVVQICSPHGLSQNDLEVKNYLFSRFHNYLLLLNKIDKLSNSQRLLAKKQIVTESQLQEGNILLISGKTSENLNVLVRTLISWI